MISLHLRKTFRNADTPFSLDVAYEIGNSQKHVVLFGPSGSGKSLTLQCLVGLTRPEKPPQGRCSERAMKLRRIRKPSVRHAIC